MTDYSNDAMLARIDAARAYVEEDDGEYTLHYPATGMKRMNRLDLEAETYSDALFEAYSYLFGADDEKGKHE